MDGGVSSEEAEWLLRPPEPSTVTLRVGIGNERAERSPELRAAVDELVRMVLQQGGQRLQGGCPELINDCSPFSCGSYGPCKPLKSEPICYSFVTCQVSDT